MNHPYDVSSNQLSNHAYSIYNQQKARPLTCDREIVVEEIFCISNRVLYSEQAGSDFIEVCEDVDCRWFHFGDNLVQSALSLKDPSKLVLPYMKAMMLPLLWTNPQRLLLLGLGGGAIPRFLRQYYPDMQIVGVEENSAVVRVANEYFHLPSESSGFHVHIADGAEFIQNQTEPYDAVVVDVFKSGRLPQEFRTERFMNQVKSHLDDNGLLVMNILVETEAEVKDLIAVARQSFDKQVLCLDVADYRNVIIFAFKSMPPNFTFDELCLKSQSAKKAYGIDYLKYVDRLFAVNPNQKQSKNKNELCLYDLFV